MTGPTTGPPTAPTPERARLPRVVWVLSAIALCVAIGFGILAPAVPVFATQFGVGATAAALVVSLFAGMRLASAWGVGRLVDRFGTKGVLTTGLVVVAVSSGLAGLSESYAMLLVLRGAGGVGSAMFTVAAASMMAAAVPSAVRGRAMSLWSGAFLFGSVAGPVIGAPLLAIGLRAPFFFYGITLAAAALVAFVGLPRVRRRRRGASSSASVDGTAEDAAEVPTEGIREAWRLPEFKVALAGDLAASWATSVRMAIVPLFVVEVLARPEQWSGYALAVAAAVNAVLLLPLGRWSDTRGRVPIVLVGGVATALAMAVLTAPPALWLLLVAMALSGLGSAAQSVGPGAILGDVANGRRGSVIATYQIVGDAGALTGPLAVGALVDLAGYGWGFAVTAVLSGFSALVALTALRRRRVTAG